MSTQTKQGNLQNNAVAQANQNIAAMMCQVMQRKNQGVHRQPPGSPSDPKTTPVSPPVRFSGPVPIPPPARSPGPPQQPPSLAPVPPPEPAVAPAPASAVASAPTPAPASVSGPTPPQDHGKYDNLPPTLRRDGRFCGWRYEPRPNSPKPAKVPYNMATGQRASVASEADFLPFGEALQRLTPEYNGLGVQIADGICAIDLDNAIGADGNPTAEAKDIILRMDCYTEVSPSGRGYRILFSVRPDFRFDSSTYYINNQKCGIEVYVAGATKKYVTLTGDTITLGVDLLDRTDQLQDVLDRYFRRPAPAPPPQTAVPPGSQPGQDLLPEDQQLIAAVRASASGELFDRLWSGDMDDYGNDHSSAGLALCNILASRTADMAQIDRVFRYSGLMRPKWDERRGNRNYGEITIAKALASAPRQGQQSAQDSQTTQAIQTAPASPPAQTSPTTPANPPAQISQSTRSNPLPCGDPIPASDLMQIQFPPLTWFVEGLLPEGVTLLAGEPKGGKSWLVLLATLTVASNATFLEHNTTQCGVLYLSLEDSERRLQDRIGRLLQGAPAPTNLYLKTKSSRLSTGLLDELRMYLDKYPDIRLIVIDTLAMIRDADASGVYSYSNDYSDIRVIREFAEKNHVSFLVVHHVRKSKDEHNPFANISGTNGIAGSVETMMVLAKNVDDANSVLYITGKDVEEAAILMAQDKTTSMWQTLGDAAIARRQQEKDAFLLDPLVQTVQELLDQSPNHSWCGQASELVAASAASHRDVGNAQSVGYALAKNANNFLTYLGVAYTGKKNGTNGKVHCFEALPPDPET